MTPVSSPPISIARRFSELVEAAPFAAFVKDADGRYVYANPHLLATMGAFMGSDWQGKTDAEMWPPEAAAHLRTRDEEAIRGGGPQVFSRQMPGSDGMHTVLLVEFALPTVDRRVGVGGIAVDVTEYSKSGAERDRFAAVIEQAAESVMLVGLDGRITYVNPAFERVTGYSRDEAVGQNPRFLSSGHQTAWFYDAMWASISSGLPWVSDLVNRRKDGSLFTEEAVISPIRDSSGAVVSYMAIKRDVTEERALTARSAQFARERALIGETMRSLPAHGSPDAIAAAICCRVVSLDRVISASLAVFQPDGRALPISFGIAGQPDPPLRPLTYQRSRHLRERVALGPWAEAWTDQPSHPYNKLLNGLGIRSAAYAPVRHGDQLVGLMVAYSQLPSGDVATSEMLPALMEFADLAGVLIGGELADRAKVARGAENVAAMILDEAFKPVFQPIVDITTNKVVGYEALTRFTNGVNPDVMFAKAAAAGLGTELEIATLIAAIVAAEGLPRSAWLNLNASPELVMAGEPLRSILRRCHRRVVLEVTEHTVIADYEAFRVAVAALGPKVELAVDDGGAGFAGLHQILELRAAFVKLDRWLVAGIESDDARQAMIVGLTHFARSTGCRLIAEGIETEAELAALRSLDVHLGQGYLLGRPGPEYAVPRPVRKVKRALS